MGKRTYEARYDNGRDYGYFRYQSCYRNNSKANMADARHELISKYGFHARKYSIVNTYLVKD